jgi:hypothetical protein
MRKLLAAAALLSAASITTIAFAQMKPDKPVDPMPVVISEPAVVTTADVVAETPVADARSLASDREVGEARRAYRNACNELESPGFCDCVTAGVAQALLPAEVRMAASTIGERINAQGDAAFASESDSTVGAESSLERIEQVEGHYAQACEQFRS